MTKQTSRKLVPLILIFIGLILVGGALAYLAGYSYQSQKVSQVESTTQRIPLPEIERISLKDARAVHEIGNAVFLDVRGSEYYQQGHIPGALSIPEDELPYRIGELSKDEWIITYCT